MIRYVSTVISNAAVGFISYWPAWMSLIMLFTWAKISFWRMGAVRISTETDSSEYYRKRRAVIPPIALFLVVLILTVVFITLVTEEMISFTWYDFSVTFGISETATEALLFFGPAICAGIWKRRTEPCCLL